MITFLLFYLPVCFLVGWLAHQKSRSFIGWFLISLLFTPFIGLLAVIAVPTKVRPVDPSRVFRPIEPALPPAPVHKKCPACAESILVEAKRCRYCGADQPAAPEAPPSPTMGYCPGCGKLRADTVAQCVYCADTAPVLAARPPS